MGGSSFDINVLVVAHIQVIIWLVSMAAFLMTTSTNPIKIPPDVIQDFTNSDPDQFLPVSWLSALEKKYKRGSTSDNVGEEFCTGRNKKRKEIIKYDRNRAYKCVMSDWIGTVPRFNDKQFERSFRLKRSLVDFIINNLAKQNKFWTHSVDSVNHLSISPHVKFLTAMKRICYGVSFSAFQDYFQMGESTARLCISNLAKVIVECPDIAEIYLRMPTRDDVKCICALHEE